MSDQPQRVSSDSVICPYCDEYLGAYPDDFISGGKYVEAGLYTTPKPVIFVCDSCNKSFRISVRMAVSIITTGEEGD